MQDHYLPDQVVHLPHQIQLSCIAFHIEWIVFPGLWKWVSTMAHPSVVTLGGPSQPCPKWMPPLCLQSLGVHPLCLLHHPCHPITLITTTTNKSLPLLLTRMTRALAWRFLVIIRCMFNLWKKVSVVGHITFKNKLRYQNLLWINASSFKRLFVSYLLNMFIIQTNPSSLI